MKPTDWTRVAGVIGSYWMHAPVPNAKQLAIQADLVRDIPVEMALAAVRARAERPDRFPPTAGEIAADVREALSPAMTWTDALVVLRRACSRFGPENTSGALGWLRDESPIVAGWVEAYGWHRFSMEPIDSEAHGHRVAARLEASFDSHARSASGRAAIRGAALGAGGSPVPQIGGGS